MINRGKILIVGDGPGVMTTMAPLLLALKAVDYDVAVSVSDSARLFTSPYGPSMLSGHPLLPWPLSEAQMKGIHAVLLMPCSEAFFRQVAADAALLQSQAHLLVAPAVLPTDDATAAEMVFRDLGQGRWQIIGASGHEENLGALGTLIVASVPQCVEAVLRTSVRQDFEGRKVLITCGPTIEDADPVRYITNRSTGRMGVAMAEMAARRGATVTLVHGPMSWPMPIWPRIQGVPVRSAQQMYEAVLANMPGQDVAILCAAVADYTPVTYSDIKIKKGHEATFALLLKRTPDILATVGRLQDKPFLVGFAAESDHVEENARGKLQGKNCDMLCANDVTEAGSGFAVGTNRVTIFTRDGDILRLPQMSKERVAGEILDQIAKRISGRE